MNKQIDEMAKELCHAPTCEVKKNGGTCYKYCKAYIYAFRAINADYRKQKKGEWHTVVDNKNDIVTECTACKKQFWFMKKGQLNIDRMPYCPNYGAHMRGGNNDE